MAEIRVSQRRVVSGMKKYRDTFLPARVQRFFAFRLVQSWLFQGFAAAHWTEILFRFSLEVIVVVGLWSVLSIWAHNAIVWALLIAHTLMWTFNGHLWALKISDKKRLVRNTPERIKYYLEGLTDRMERTESITACVLSGSLTRGKFHEYSDLDVWFTKRKGFFNGLWAFLLGVRERSIAFLHRIPIELYFYDPDNYEHLDAGEKLLLIKDVEARWGIVEPDSISLEDFPLGDMDFFATERK